MRDRKYRAYDLVNEKMYYDVSIGGFKYTVPTVFIDEEWKCLCGSNKDCVVMDYIGLEDKNEKEIFEDDIVKYNAFTPIGAYYKTGIVVFRNGCFIIDHVDKKNNCFGLLWVDDIVKNHLHQDFEVIGNFWENGELLK